MSTPTARTLAMLREDGWIAEVVERWVPGANIRKDLFGFVDIVAIREGVTMGVQATSYSNVSARVNKIADSPLVAHVREAGWRLVVHGWHKIRREGDKRDTWHCRQVDVS